jgi:[protein-PII] uridylyltransferase
MRAYFTGAKAIHRQALRAMDTYESKGNALLAGFRDWRSRLSTSEFTIARDLILFKTPNHAKSDPTAVLRLFELVARHRLALHPETERRLHDALPELTTFFASTSFNWSQLSSLLSLPYPSAALRAMHDTGILKLLLPPWADIESYVVRDFHHRYTVDEHTLIALETLDHLPANTDPAHQRFRNLYLELDHLPVLRLAILLHDTGKSTATTTHADASAALAQQLAARLAIPPAASQLLHTLVAQHLALSSAMTTRDLDDPATARHLAQLTGTVEVLKHLTLLTYADTAAVNPTALSPWRLEQLWRLYLTTYRELTLELDLERITETTPEADSPERRAFLKGFPTRYLRIHTDAEINHHLELEQRRRADNVAVEIRKQGALYHLTVLAKDRLFLFASVAGALASFNLNILKAEAFSNQQGTILDTFVFSDPTRSLELNPSELERLQHVLERILLGRLDAKSLLRHRPQPNPPSKNSRIRPTISFDSTTSSTSTLVEVVAQDRPGLLYDLATAFSEAGCNIEVVLVTTEAHKAIDVFYVTAAGAKLPPHLQQDLHRRLLAACQP